MKNNKTSWGGVADWYDELLSKDNDSYQAKVVLPNLLRIVDPKDGMKVVDIACGQGFFSRAIADKGAQVVGADISKELISIAEKHSKGKNLKYHVASADNMKVIENESADVVTVVLAIQNIENMPGAFSEAHRILKKGGRFVMVLNHPSFRIPNGSSWGWDNETGAQYRRIDNYMSDVKSEMDMNPGEKNPSKKEFTISFHRPLQSYFKAFNKAGLAVTRLEEWISHKTSEPGVRSEEENRMRKEIPMFVMIEAKKI